jgi:hypothetical protein
LTCSSRWRMAAGLMSIFIGDAPEVSDVVPVRAAVAEFFQQD